METWTDKHYADVNISGFPLKIWRFFIRESVVVKTTCWKRLRGDSRVEIQNRAAWDHLASACINFLQGFRRANKRVACHLSDFSLRWLFSLRNWETSASPSATSPPLGNSLSASWRQRTWRRWTPVDYLVKPQPALLHRAVRNVEYRTFGLV